MTTDRISRVLLVSACALTIVLGTALARTRLPICDEGFYGVPAHIFSTTGSLRNPILESAGVSYLQGINQTFYWMAPLAMVLQAAAFTLFGFGLMVQRELSVLCGLGAVIFWYLALRKLAGDRIAALAALFLSADFVFLSLTSLGRSDMISLFFGMSALAGYMHWRERSLPVALAVANTACALCGMVHPNGGIAALVSLTILTLYLDRTRLRWSYLAIVAACYGLLGFGWALYIAKAPQLFEAQFLGNVAARFVGPVTVTSLWKGEVTRYLAAFGLKDAYGLKQLRYLLPVSYLIAILFCALSTELRRRYAVLLLMFVGISLSLVFLEGSKHGWYLVHLSPLFCAFLAITTTHLWASGRPVARMAAAVQCAIASLGVASVIFTMSSRNLEREYQPTSAYLNAHLSPTDLVFARSEFYFTLQCRTCLRDDVSLGSVSGLRANYIVLDTDYSEHLAKLRVSNPASYREIEQRLHTEYREVFHSANYHVLQRTT